MPTYTYKRKDGTKFDVRQKITDEPLEKCPDTGQDVERVITGGAGVHFKGDGFYTTSEDGANNPASDSLNDE